jgi:hypothetical protein
LRERQAENVLRQLERLGLDPEVAAEIASIDPDGSYAMVVTLRGYNGSTRSRDLTYAGRGRGLWERIAWLAGGDEVEIVDVLFEPLLAFSPEYQGSYALWKRDAAVTASGDRFEGVGDFVRWRKQRDARVGGRPKKRRGRHTYAEGKRVADANRKADARARASRAKLGELRERAKRLESSGARGLAASLRAQAKRLDKKIKAGRRKKK